MHRLHEIVTRGGIELPLGTQQQHSESACGALVVQALLTKFSVENVRAKLAYSFLMLRRGALLKCVSYFRRCEHTNRRQGQHQGHTSRRCGFHSAVSGHGLTVVPFSTLVGNNTPPHSPPVCCSRSSYQLSGSTRDTCEARLADTARTANTWLTVKGRRIEDATTAMG